MIAIMRRDPILSWPLPKWLLMLGLNAFLVEGIRGLLAYRARQQGTSEIVSLLLAAAILWLPVTIVVLAGRFGERCSALDLALPLAARRLWLAHLAVIFLVSAVLITLSGGMMALHRAVVGGLAARLEAPLPPFSRMALPIIAALLLTITLPHAWKPWLYRIPRDGRYWRHAALTLAAGYTLVVLLSLPRAPVALIPLALALALAYRTYRSVPESFVVAARMPEAGARIAGRTGSADAASEWDREKAPPAPGSVSFPLFMLKAVYAAASKKRAALAMTCLLLLLWGYLMAALSHGGILSSSEDMDLFQTTLLAYLLFTLSVTPLSRLYLVDAWPVSRRFLFGFLVGIPFVSLLIGYGAGAAIHGARRPARELVVFKSGDEPGLFPPYRLRYLTVRVPPQCTRIAWDGHVPDISSPWGETHPAWSMPMVAGLPMRLYSPYSTSESASARFVALQISRAAETVYGRTLPPDEIEARYLGGREETTPVTLRADYPGMTAPGWIAFAPTLMAAAFILWMAATAAFLRFCRAGVSDGFRKGVFIGIAALLLSVHVGFFVSGVTGFIRPDVASNLWRKTVFESMGVLPGGELSLWLLCVIVMAAAYRLAECGFEKIELPTPRVAAEM